MLVQMERQIDREIAADNKANGIAFGTQTEYEQMTTIGTEIEEFDSDSEEEEGDDGPPLMYGPQPQIVTNDLKSLDEMVSSIIHFFVVSSTARFVLLLFLRIKHLNRKNFYYACNE